MELSVIDLSAKATKRFENCLTNALIDNKKLCLFLSINSFNNIVKKQKKKTSFLTDRYSFLLIILFLGYCLFLQSYRGLLTMKTFHIFY